MTSTRMNRRSTAFGWILSICAIIGTWGLAKTVAAQTAVDGAVGGTVVDSSGAVIPNASIGVQNTAKIAVSTISTDSN